MAGLPSSEPRSAWKNYVPLWCGHSGGRRMRGLSSNGAENRVKASSLLDRLAILLKRRPI